MQVSFLHLDANKTGREHLPCPATSLACIFGCRLWIAAQISFNAEAPCRYQTDGLLAVAIDYQSPPTAYMFAVTRHRGEDTV
jgi:hypothetical protein